MARAVELSLGSKNPKASGPFGAVIVHDGKIVGEGFNQVTALNDPTAHAEVQAIRSACKNLNTFSLERAVIFTSCEPCPMCLTAIMWARIPQIYFANSRDDASQAGFDDSKFYQQVSLPLNQREIHSMQIPDPNAALAFSEWVTDPKNIPY